MTRRMLAAATGVLVAFVLAAGGLERKAEAQVPGPGGIVIIGVDLSGEWDFSMTVIESSDPAMIGTVFRGAFAVTGGVPTYSGSGTFNGLPATISGSGAVDPGTLQITLSDHIAASDSETHFTATLLSGDFGTGTFTGGTLDELQTWSGVFDLKIARTPTQTPAQQIESAFATAGQRVQDAGAVAASGIQQIASAAAVDIAIAATETEKARIRREAEAAMLAVKSAAFREIEQARRDAEDFARALIAQQPRGDQAALRRLVGGLTRDLSRISSDSTRLVNDAFQEGVLLLRGIEPCHVFLEIRNMSLGLTVDPVTGDLNLSVSFDYHAVVTGGALMGVAVDQVEFFVEFRPPGARQLPPVVAPLGPEINVKRPPGPAPVAPDGHIEVTLEPKNPPSAGSFFEFCAAWERWKRLEQHDGELVRVFVQVRVAAACLGNGGANTDFTMVEHDIDAEALCR